MENKILKTRLTEELNYLMNMSCTDLGKIQSRYEWCKHIIDMLLFADVLTKDEYNVYKQDIYDIYKDAVEEYM